MTLRTRFEPFLVFDPNRSPATANVWISHPSPTEEQALGKLVIVSHLHGTDRLNLDVITLLQEELRGAYYQTTDTKPERAFENAIQQLNRRLHQVITDGVSHWVDGASILIVAIWRETVMMSMVGNMHAYLLRRSRMHDLLGPPDNLQVNPVRMFAQVVSGQILADDQLLFCTPSLLDYFSLEKLRRTMIDGRPSATVHQWETTLLGIEQQSACAAVLVQAQANDAVVTPVSRPVQQSTLTQSAPQASMEHLIAKEQATERLLSPSMWPAVRDVMQQLGHGFSTLSRRFIFHKPPRRIVPHSLQAAPPVATRASSSWWLATQRVAGSLIGTVGKFFRVFVPRRSGMPKPPAPVTMAPTLKRRWSMSLNQLVRWIQRLNRRQQAFLGAAVLLIIVLAIAVFPKSSPSTNTNTSVADPVATIQDHLSQARAALLYGGELTAQQEVDAAQQLVNALPNKSKSDKSTKTDLQNNVNDVLTQLAHQTTIDHPAVVADLNVSVSGIQAQQLYLVGTKLVAVDPDGQHIVSLTPGGTNAPEEIALTRDIGKPLTGAVNSATSITFATDQLGMIELNVAQQTWRELDVAWPDTSPTVQALAAYQSRIYALDTAHQSIDRFNRGGTSLGTGLHWLKVAADLSSARSLSVDGSIYVLQPNAVVEQYANGRKNTFALPTITPTLTNPTRLWTDENTTNLYLLEPANHRLLVVSKSGKLIDQYSSTDWSNLRDMAINVATKTAYVLSGNTITSFTLIH